MTTTWTEVNRKLDLFLDDAERTGASQVFPVSLRVEAWNWAQRTFCHHTPRQRSRTLEIDAGQRAGIVPADCFAIHGIYDSDRERWWWPVDLLPGDIQYTDDDVAEYWIWGNELFLDDEISYSSTDLTLYYWAYWPDVEYSVSDSTLTYIQEQIYVPTWSELALVHLTTATVLMPMELFAADINEYKIRVDSGTPLHNPRAQSADFHLRWWHHILDMFPPARDAAR